ncbi:Root phototropism protein 2 [Linum perenne]
MLVAKSNYIRKVIIDSKEADLTRIDLSDIPGGPEIFEKAAKFCYGVNFEITVHNVAALRCAAEYLQMTEAYCDGNLASRTEDFLSQVALSSLAGAVVVLKSCEDLLPLAQELKIVQRCVEVISLKVICRFLHAICSMKCLNELRTSVVSVHTMCSMKCLNELRTSSFILFVLCSIGLQRGELPNTIAAQLVDGGAIDSRH